MASPGYFEKKGDSAVLKSKLQDAFNKKDIKLMRGTIKKIIAMMTLGIDVASIFPEVIRYSMSMASERNDIVLKKLVYLYICSCAEAKQDLAFLTVNSLVKDAQHDMNPMIRGLAIRSMLNIRIESLVQYMKTPLLSGLNDSSSYVRKNAVVACIKLYHISPSVFEEMELLSKLFIMLRDHDSQVSVNAFVAIDEVLASSGGFPLDRQYTVYFLERLSKYNEWSQCILLQRLTKYQPETDDEVIDYLNYLDSRLRHANKGVVMAAINVFLQFTKHLESIHADIYMRVKDPLLSMLSSTTPEVVFTVLNHIMVLCSLQTRLFNKDYKSFFLRDNEPVFVRLKKLEVLTEIVTEGNLQNIIDELRWHVRDADALISTKAIIAIGKIAYKTTISIQPCVTSIIEILHYEVDYITSNCLEILQDLMVADTSVALQVLPELSSCWEQVQDHPKGKAALIWIYGEYGEDIPTAPYHLEEIVNSLDDELSALVKLHLLTAMMKLFLKRPAECQQMLQKLLKYCIDEENKMDIRDRALFYYRLLKDINQAKSIMQYSSAQSQDDKIHRVAKKLSSEDFRFREFNTLSIIYDQPCIGFITKRSWVKELSSSLEFDTLAEDMYENATVELRQPVVEANILNLDDFQESASVAYHFDKMFVLQKDVYQSDWKEYADSLVVEKELTVNPEHAEISGVMMNIGIQIMASSPPNKPIWRFFMYAKEIDNDSIYLVQLDIYNQQQKLVIVTKSNDRGKLEKFTDFYKDIFVGKWIACSP